MAWQTVRDARAAADRIVERLNVYLSTHPLDRQNWHLDRQLIADVVDELDPRRHRGARGQLNQDWHQRVHGFYDQLQRRLRAKVYGYVVRALFDAQTDHPS